MTELVGPVADLERVIRRDRRELAGQRRLLDRLLEALADPVLLIDRRRRVVRANPAAERSFGSGLAGVDLGRAIRDPAVLAALAAAVEADAASSIAFSPAGDRHKRFAARIEPVRLPDGQPGVLMAFREQSEQVMIERMRSDFIANASHEMRTPLAAIHGLIETIQGPARNDAAAREAFLGTMAEEAERMTRLVDDLLSLSRVELVAHSPPTDPCDVSAVLAAVVNRLRPLAVPRHVTLELDLDRQLPAIRGDRDQLHQLFTNLVDNAVKYGGEGKPVTVRAERRAAAPMDAGQMSGRTCIEVAVTDRGEGIAKEHIPRLTERFYRVDKARSRGQGGTGLGLAIVKHIVRRHEGYLAIESEPGRGSTFRVLLPVPESSSAESMKTQPQVSGSFTAQTFLPE